MRSEGQMSGAVQLIGTEVRKLNQSHSFPNQYQIFLLLPGLITSKTNPTNPQKSIHRGKAPLQCHQRSRLFPIFVVSILGVRNCSHDRQMWGKRPIKRAMRLSSQQ
jgi:hypothetical protein